MTLPTCLEIETRGSSLCRRLSLGTRPDTFVKITHEATDKEISCQNKYLGSARDVEISRLDDNHVEQIRLLMS